MQIRMYAAPAVKGLIHMNSTVDLSTNPAHVGIELLFSTNDFMNFYNVSCDKIKYFGNTHNLL